MICNFFIFSMAMKKFPVRVVSQILVLVIIVWLALGHQWYGIEKFSPIHAYCPFGALEWLFTYLFSGQFIQKLYRSNFILLGIFVVLTLFFGRVFCGFFCPIGAISEWLRKLWKKIGFKKDIELPAKIDKYLRYLKYVVLLAIVYFSFQYTALVFDSYDPFSAFAHLGNEFDELIFAYAVLGFVVITALFSKGRWCRYLCPLGAFFGLVSKIGFFKLKRDKITCTGCGSCNRSCPANLNIKDAPQIKDADCISCMNCVTVCPHTSLTIHVLGKDIKKQTFTWAVVWIFFVTLAIVIRTPMWQTKPASNIISDQWIVEVTNIKWSNTLKYVIEITKIPLSYFQEQLGIPADVDTSMKLKEIGTTYDIKDSEWNLLDTEDFRAIIDAKLTQ